MVITRVVMVIARVVMVIARVVMVITRVVMVITRVVMVIARVVMVIARVVMVITRVVMVIARVVMVITRGNGRQRVHVFKQKLKFRFLYGFVLKYFPYCRVSSGLFPVLYVLLLSYYTLYTGGGLTTNCTKNPIFGALCNLCMWNLCKI